MLELILGLVAGTGIVGIIVAVVKWLVSSMGKQVDRMGDHVDRLDNLFQEQTSQLLSGMEGVRQEVSTVRDALHEHTRDEMNTWKNIDKRLDENDQTHFTLMKQIDDLQTQFRDHTKNSNGNGKSAFAVKLEDE